jgi:hypothetical protein
MKIITSKKWGETLGTVLFKVLWIRISIDLAVRSVLGMRIRIQEHGIYQN